MDIINSVLTKKDFENIYQQINITEGMNVMLHVAMSKLGYIVNGANDIIDALLNIIGVNGTLIMSSNSGNLTDPAQWKNPQAPSEFVDKIKENMRPFDKKTTPIWNRGAVANIFMQYEGVERSNHPIRSVIAKGHLAKYFTETHPLHEPEGLDSPLYKFYQSKGYSLMLGVNTRVCSIFHVAEFIANVPYLEKNEINVLVAEKEMNQFIRLKKYSEAHYFNKIENQLFDRGYLKSVKMNNTDILLLDVFNSINFAVETLRDHPNYFNEP